MAHSADAPPVASGRHPDDAESGLRRAGKALAYRLLTRLIHQPALLRAAMPLKRWLRVKSVVGTFSGVTAVAARTSSFSNLAHHDDLPESIDFVIGMDGGPRMRAEREFLEQVLAPPGRFAAAADARSRAGVDLLRRRSSFDLIDDYLVDVVWSALRESFGSAAAVLEKDQGAAAVRCPFTALYAEMRYVGAQLIGGSFAPPRVRDRAVAMAAALNERVHRSVDAIRAAWSRASPPDDTALERNAAGLMWVGHPATVQAGALIMQSLLADAPLYKALRQDVGQAVGDAWTDAALRGRLRGHVLELLRFRPPFPVLNRDVLRDTDVDADGRQVSLKAGSGVALFAVAAMFDPKAIDQPSLYWPGRPDRAFSDPDHRYLMFGIGERSCIAKRQVVETLVSALIGLLLLPEMRYARRWSRITYDGPAIVRMPLQPA